MINYIENCRHEYVTRQAKELFNVISSLMAHKVPSEVDEKICYDFVIRWNSPDCRNPGTKIDQMIFDRVTDMFNELDISIDISRQGIKNQITVSLLQGVTLLKKNITFYWSNSCGMYVNKRTGKPSYDYETKIGPQFTGTKSQWNELLVDTILDCARDVETTHHCRKLDTIYVNASVLSILETSMRHKPVIEENSLRGTIRGMLCNVKIIVNNDLDNRVIIALTTNGVR